MTRYSLSDKIIATLCYLTFGLIGIVFLLLSRVHSHFCRFHLLQSLVIGLVGIFLTQGLNILSDILQLILHSLTQLIHIKLFWLSSISFRFWIWQIITSSQILISLYCIINLWREKYSWLPLISENLYKNL